MHDKKLCWKAMVKIYTLQQLLAHAAIKEDIDRQAYGGNTPLCTLCTKSGQQSASEETSETQGQTKA